MSSGFVQPHPFIVLVADTGKAEPQRWHLELDNHRELVQVGVTKDTFRPGDEVIVTGDPARDGNERLYIRKLHRPLDGLRYDAPGFHPQYQHGSLTHCRVPGSVAKLRMWAAGMFPPEAFMGRIVSSG